MTKTTQSPPAPYAALAGLMSDMTGDEKHQPSATSTLDVLWVLYDRILHVDPAHTDDPTRDRFFLSKGHGPVSYYAVLAAKGFIPRDWLPTIGRFESHLGYHPDRLLIPGVEISSGSLGHGMPLAIGTALALRAQRNRARVFVMVGDAELDEGSNYEAIAYAARARLDRLTVAVIDNSSSSHGWPGGVARRFETEGWTAATIDGRDHAQIAAAFEQPHDGTPHAVIARVEPKWSNR